MKEEKKYNIEDLPPMSKEEKEFWEEHNNEYYHYLYRIDNKLNGKFYYGIHSEKKDNELGSDGYMGSGVDLVKDQKKDGIENFEKTIIKTFSTRDEARLEEFIVVNEELVEDPNCYNKVVGGGVMFITSDLVVVNYKDKSLRKNKFFLVTTEEYQNNKDKYITPSSDRITVKYKDNSLNINNSFFTINSDEYYKNKDKYITPSSRRSVYRNILDKNDIRVLDTNDPLVLSGKFIGITKGIKRGNKYKQKITGEKNSMYGSMWITDGKENKVIKNQKIPEGWWKGRTMNKTYPVLIKSINKNTLEVKYIEKGNVDCITWFPYMFYIEGRIVEKEEFINIAKTCESWKEVAKKLHSYNEITEKFREYYNIPGNMIKNKFGIYKQKE